MANAIGNWLKHAWNAFTDQNQRAPSSGANYGMRPDRTRLNVVNERSIIASVYTRLGIDSASIELRHVRLDQNGRFVEVIHSSLNECFSVEANLDQGARAFRQDIAMSLFENGVIAIVPVDTTLDPSKSGTFEVKTMRVGGITEWFPEHVRVRLYNQKTGTKEEIILPKATTAIVENPLYAVMNEPNSTLQRLVRKLNLLDAIDEQSSSGKLDLIIQLPYAVKSDLRKKQAEDRRKDIEVQLMGSKYGIAYIDGTERVTQLNRPAENNLLAQITYLTEMLYSQLGLTEEIFKGTADEATMLNYHNRTIEPIVAAIAESIHRTMLTKTARSQGQAFRYFRDPFKFLTLSQLAEIGDTLTRNEITASNELRPIFGLAQSKDPGADQLRNKNLNPVEPTPPGPNQGVNPDAA